MNISSSHKASKNIDTSNFVFDTYTCNYIQLYQLYYILK